MQIFFICKQNRHLASLGGREKGKKMARGAEPQAWVRGGIAAGWVGAAIPWRVRFRT